MIVTKAHAVAFGPLSGETLELGAPMNVICGPNEAGKSSWHAAIFAALCGRRRGKGAGTKAEQEFKGAHRPWSGERWAVRVELELADGRTVEIAQDLDEPGDSRVTDLVTGGDLTAEFAHDGSPDASRLLGLSRDTMLATATVRQTEIIRVQESPEALQRQLQAATTQAGADETAQAALERIDAYHREYVGRRQRNSVRPLQAAIRRVAEADAALEEVREARRSYRGLREEHEAAREEYAACLSELESAQTALERFELESQKDRLRRARELSERLPQGEQPDLDALMEEAGRIRGAVLRFEQRPTAQRLPDGATVEELSRELSALPEMPAGETEVARDVDATYSTWRHSRTAVATHEKYRPRESDAREVEAAGSELRQLADALEAESPEFDADLGHEIEALEARARVLLWKLGSLWLGTLFLVASVGMWLMDVQSNWSLGAGVFGAIAVIIGLLPTEEGGRSNVVREIRYLEAELAARQIGERQAAEERRRAEQRLDQLDLPRDPEHLREEAERQETARETRRALETWEVEQAELEAQLDADRQALFQALEGRVEADELESPDFGPVIEQYREACRARAEQARQATRRPDLEERLAARRALESTAAEAAALRTAAARQAIEIAKDLGIASIAMDQGDLEGVVQSLKNQEQKLTSDYTRWNRARQDAATLEGLLAGRTLDDLALEVETAEARLTAREDEPDASIVPGADPKATVDDLRRRFGDARARLERLEGRIETEEADSVPQADAEEELERANAELARVETLEATLHTTRDFLQSARERVQRDIAPHLRDFLEANLAAVTQGRYREARVDPANLEVTVKTPDGSWQRASDLSHGTMEQIYLLLRVALVRHMTRAGEPAPIFLDDPTVQSDDSRTEAILEVLRRLSAEHQIVLFSQEEDVRRWARQQQETNPYWVRLIELGSPPGSE